MAPACCRPPRRPERALLIERTGSRERHLEPLQQTDSRRTALPGIRPVRAGAREPGERAIHLRIAAELVELKPFFIPVYRDTRSRPWQLKSGSGFTRCLAGSTRPRALAACRSGNGRTRRTEDAGSGGRHPLSRRANQRCSVKPGRGKRRAFEVGRRTGDAGAIFAACGFERGRGGRDLFRSPTGLALTCRARVLVNAAGPSAMQAARAVEPAISIPDVDLVQGTHIVIPHPLTAGHLLRGKPPPTGAPCSSCPGPARP